MKQRLPRKKKKQSRLVSKWLAAHPGCRPVGPCTNRLLIQTFDVHPKKFHAYVREGVEFCDTCQDAMQRIRHSLAEAFVEAIEQHIDVYEVTDEYDKQQYKRRFEAFLSIVDE